MQDQMIERIIDVMERYKFKNIRIFCNKKMTAKSLAPAFALNEFLQYIGLDSMLIVENKEDMPIKYEKVIGKPDLERYLAIAVDCQKETDIENEFYRESTTLLNVYSPLSTKGYGVLNFKTENVSGTSEYMVAELMDYCVKNDLALPINIAEWLYLGIIGATRRFGTNIKKNTMLVAKQLIDLEINYGKVNYIYERCETTALRCQEVILRNLIEKDHYVYAIIKLSDYDGLFGENDFYKALNAFRNISESYMVALFIEQSDETFKALLGTNDYYKANVRHIARKNNGDGDNYTAEAVIQDFDLSKMIGDIEIACERIGQKEEFNEEF